MASGSSVRLRRRLKTDVAQPPRATASRPRSRCTRAPRATARRGATWPPCPAPRRPSRPTRSARVVCPCASRLPRTAASRSRGSTPPRARRPSPCQPMAGRRGVRFTPCRAPDWTSLRLTSTATRSSSCTASTNRALTTRWTHTRPRSRRRTQARGLTRGRCSRALWPPTTQLRKAARCCTPWPSRAIGCRPRGRSPSTLSSATKPLRLPSSSVRRSICKPTATRNGTLN